MVISPRTILSLIFFCLINLFGQEADSFLLDSSDSLAIAETDSLLTDSLAIMQQDSVSADSASSDQVDDVVYTSAQDSLSFNVRDKKMSVYGKGELKYKQSSLTSGKILIDFPTNSLEAFGVADTADTTGEGLIETPALTEQGETYEGKYIQYNFKNQRGYISLAKNETEDSRYSGKVVKKVSKDVYFIQDGIYTTCGGDDPVTYFTADKMKVIHKDKVIAEWIFIYIGGVPLPVPLPFAVFPAESGRRSGIIAPSYGQMSKRGWYFSDFGYYFALSDYMDLTLTGDYYTRGGWGTGSRFRYAKRYEYSGNINAGYSVISYGEEDDPDRSKQIDWSLSVYHNQTFNPSTKFNANLQFQSSSYLTNNSTSYNDLLTQNIISNATFNKEWDNQTSLSINYSRTQKLKSGDISETLPSVKYNVPIFYPFQRESTKSDDEKWYELIGIKYSSQFENERNKEDGHLDIRGGFRHDVSVSASPKFGYFSFTPSVGYTEKWYNKSIKKELVTETLVDSSGASYDSTYVATSDVKKINFVRTYNFAVSAQTKLYGMFNINNFGIQAIRHTVTPVISYSYTPDFSKNSYGYYGSYVDTSGSLVKYNRFADEVFGGPGSGESQSINLSVSNLFEMKTAKDPTDTSSQQKKVELLNLTASTGYNFAAEEFKLRDLSLRYSTKIGSILNLSGSSVYSFYVFENNKTVNKYMISHGRGLMRMTNFSLSMSTSISGKSSSDDKKDDNTGDDEESEYAAFNKRDYALMDDDVPSDLSIPWELGLDYSYSLNKTDPEDPYVNSTLGADLSLNLTTKWKITFSGSYDFEAHELVTPRISVYRDLDCWEMNFSWNPSGTYSGFNFQIRMKAPELQDIKVTKTRDFYTGR